MKKIFLLFLLLGSMARAESLFEPTRTRALVIGLLSWQRSDLYEPFTTENRRDVQLVELLESRGVEVTYLQDGQATLEAIQQALTRVARACGPQDQLLIYYCGHGSKSESGEDVLLANWDAGEEDHTNLSAASILETVRQTFHGQRVLFLIDCCSSGGLAEQLQEQPGEKPALALTSSSANESSTDAWTFTQALLDGLRGEPHLDLDRDGTILLSELARSIRLDMASFHGQMAAFVTTNRFPTNLELSRVARQPDPGEGERVEAKDEGAWWPARVIRREGDRILVRWLALGFDTAASDEWKKPQQVRSLASGPVYPGGTRVEVKWKNRFYPAVVLKVEDGIHLVHYLDYGSEWDEWVPARRIKKPD